MKTKLITLFVALICAAQVFAYDAKIDGIFYNFIDNTAEVTYEIKNWSSDDSYSYAGEIIIPKTVFYNDITYNVTKIGEDAFMNCVNLVSITIPNTIKSISVGAFAGCKALSSLIVETKDYPIYVSQDNCIIDRRTNQLIAGCKGAIIPSDGSVSSIAENAFYGSGITDIIIPDAITEIGENAFTYSDVHSVIIGKGLTGITSWLFSECSNLIQIIIPENIRWISKGAFSGSGLQQITIPYTIETIHMYAFDRCTNLKKVNYTGTIDSWCQLSPSSDEDCRSNPLSYGADFYINNVKVTEIEIHGNPERAFSGCTSIQTITFSNNVSSIASKAFAGCSALTTIISQSTTPPSLGNEAFPENVKIIVSCGSTETYMEDIEWAQYSNYEETFLIDWSVVSENENYGTVLVAKSPTACDDNTATFAAIAASGYKFKAWNDGNTDNPRTVAITEEITYTAHFINENNVDGISLDATQLNLHAGEAHQLTATITPATALNKNMTWTSTNENVASVSTTGLVTAHNSGSTNITVTTADGGFTATCQVNVIVPMTYIAFKQNHITLEVGDLDYLNTIVTPANADRGTWYWYSNNESVVSVVDGLVTAHQVGTATITLNAIDYMLSATCEIAVVDEIVNVEDSIVVDPADNSVTITWSAVEGAAYYILVIYADEAQTEKICTLTFDAHGRLINLNFQRNKPTATHEDNLLNFTVTGLQPNTTYGYSMSSYNEEETILTNKIGAFTTTSNVATAVETSFMASPNQVHKVLENGTIYIIRNGEKYTIDGRKVE